MIYFMVTVVTFFNLAKDIKDNLTKVEKKVKVLIFIPTEIDMKELGLVIKNTVSEFTIIFLWEKDTKVIITFIKKSKKKKKIK